MDEQQLELMNEILSEAIEYDQYRYHYPLSESEL